MLRLRRRAAASLREGDKVSVADSSDKVNDFCDDGGGEYEDWDGYGLSWWQAAVSWLVMRFA